MMRRVSRAKAGAGSFGTIAMLVSLSLAALGQFLLQSSPGHWFFLILGVAMVAGGGFLLFSLIKGREELREVKFPLAWEAGGLIFILILATLLRVYRIDTLPNAGFRDEGENGNVAIRLMNGEVVDGTNERYPVYVELNTTNAIGYMYPVALAFKVLGISITSERTVSIIFGVLSVIGFYFLARLLLGVPMALILAAVLAALRWHINFSRIGFLGIMTLFLEIPLFYFLWKGLNQERTDSLKHVSLPLLMGALLLAAFRGFLNLNRFGAAGLLISFIMQAPLLWCVIRGFKDRRSSYLIGAGIVLAFALYSYIAARLLVLVTAGQVLYFVVLRPSLEQKRSKRWIYSLLGLAALGCVCLVEGSDLSKNVLLILGKALLAAAGGLGLWYLWLQKGFWKEWMKPLAMATGACLLAVGPFYNYTILNWTEVFARSSRVSIFNVEVIGGDHRPWGTKLKENISATLGMYNVRGDGNPRHNLPGEIMLDPVLAAWFALGVFLCLLRWKQPRSFFLLLWWQVMLLAGYFSIEAPQAYRTIGAIPTVLLIAGEAGQAVWFSLRRENALFKGTLAGLLGVLLVGGAVYEVHTYFVNQAQDPGCWAEFSAGEYLMGKDLKSYPNTRGVVRADWADSYTFRFMTYPERNFQAFDPSRDVPLRDIGPYRGQNWMYILDNSYLPLLPMIKKFYPHGQYNEVHHPFTKELLYWTYYVPAQDVQRGADIHQGLSGSYFSDINLGGQHWSSQGFRFKRVDPFVLFNWTVDPVPGYFSVEWKGRIKIEKAGLYHFYTFSNDYASLELAGHQIVERGHLPEGDAWGEGSIHLRKGIYPIRIRYYEGRNYSRMEAWWQTPDGNKEVLPYDVLLPE